jgi:hypothetical protein
MLKTTEFNWLKQKDNILGQEIISSIYERISQQSHILDPYIITQLKKCGTLDRVVEVYFAEYLISLGLDVSRDNIFDFLICLSREHLY